jgi:CBS domain-containing protein
MQIKEAMTRDVDMADPDMTIDKAAKLMAKDDIGFLPVSENDRLIGMLTDRDIAVRAVARGKDASRTKVRDVMTDHVLYCYEDEGIDTAAENMANLQIRRMPVVNRDKRLVGIISLADIARKCDSKEASHALKHIAKPTRESLTLPH